MHYKKYKSILSAQNGMNLYRGCQHGCIYCDSRSLCYQMHHDFEDIEVKEGAVEQLTQELLKKRKKCMVGTGAMTDPYIPLEKELLLTRRCAEVICKLGFGLTLITKSTLVLRDLDVLQTINQKAKCVVQMTLTTFDEDLCRLLEPRVSTTRERFEALKILRDSGIPTVVWLCPILPFINDTEENLRGILDYCVQAKVRGIMSFDMGLTLRDGDREYFYAALDKHFPGMKEKYIRTFGNAYQCPSPNRRTLYKIFNETCKAHNILNTPEAVFAYLNEFPQEPIPQQLSFF